MGIVLKYEGGERELKLNRYMFLWKGQPEFCRIILEHKRQKDYR
jgi:hypothetical protein